MALTQNRKAYSGSTGRVAEVRFFRAAQDKGLSVEKSTRNDDIHLHVDYWLAYDGKGRWGVDVKGNNLPDEIWVEFLNVRGNPGWLYGGAKIIAFDMAELGGFVIVDREELAEYCEKNVLDVVVSKKTDAYKKKYRRKDRLDLITKLNLLDLNKLESFRIWEYFTDY